MEAFLVLGVAWMEMGKDLKRCRNLRSSQRHTFEELNVGSATSVSASDGVIVSMTMAIRSANVSGQDLAATAMTRNVTHD